MEKKSQNEKRESAFISTATLIDILKVEQLFRFLTTASYSSAGNSRGRGNGAKQSQTGKNPKKGRGKMREEGRKGCLAGGMVEACRCDDVRRHVPGHQPPHRCS